MTMTTIGHVPDGIARAVILPSAYADLDGVVYPACKWLRENAPVASAEIEGYDPVWLISKHEDIKHVLRDATLFHSADANVMLQPKVGDEYLRSMLGGTTCVFQNLTFMEPPEHRRYRQATSDEFMLTQVRKREPRFREIAKEAVARLIAHESDCDFVEVVSSRYALQIVLEMVGVPPEDYDLLLTLSRDTIGGDDPDWRREGVPATAEGMATQWYAAVQEFTEYFEVIRQDRLMQPRDDLATAIVTARLENGELMPERIQNHLTATMASAGHDTVSSAISAGIHGLALFPEQFEKVRANPQLIPGLVDESIRWATPARHFMRNATRATVLGGTNIAAGDRLMCLLLSGNRDEDVFPDPTLFDVTRRPNPHLSFGFGPHLCLGQHIAKIEMCALFEELVSKLRSIELAGAPTMKVSNFIGGWKTLPIRFRKM
jgi:cytochrome P450